MEFGSTAVTVLIMVALFFIGAILKRQLADLAGYEDFNLISAVIVSELLFILIAYFFTTKIAFLVGIVGLIVGGVGVGMVFGEGGYDGGY